MRNGIKSGLCLLALVAIFSGCISEEIAPQEKNDGKSLQLNYNVDGSNVQTLATRAVPGTLAENAVDNVMVLFFAPTDNGSGTYIGYAASVTSDNPASASGTSRVSMPAGQEVEAAYSLIILGNYTRYLRQGSSSNLEEFLTNALTGASTSDPAMPYENIFHLVYQMNPEKRFLIPICGSSSNPTAAIGYYFCNSSVLLYFDANAGTTKTFNYSSTEGYSLRCVRR